MSENDCTTGGAKACSRCGEVKALDEFQRKSRNRDGRSAACRLCCNAADAARYLANPTRVTASGAAWYAANRPRVLERRRDRHVANRTRENALTKAWRLANPERFRAAIARWRAANKDRARDTNARWYLANVERVARRGAEWNAANRDKVAAIWMARRARVRSAPVVERISREYVWARDGGVCHLCGLPADRATWEVDHVVPLSRGGEHSYRNVAVSHRVCNRKKGARHEGS